MRHRKFLAPVITALLLMASSIAAAHAFLDHSEPKVGATVAAPSEVKAWFTEPIEPAFSTLQVFDSSGSQVDSKDAHVDEKDSALLIVSLPRLQPGTYTVRWRVVALDTHRTHGEFQFNVGP